MTCIVGIERDGDVWIGGDSAGVDDVDFALHVRADEKVFVRERAGERWVFGTCGSVRIGQLLRYALELPVLDPAADDEETNRFMVTDFVDAVRTCLAENGALLVSKGIEEGARFLVGFRGALFYVDDDFQVGRTLDPYAAVGCGDQVAHGALFVLTRDPSIEPEDRALAALEASERFSAGVRGPFHVVTTAIAERQKTRSRA